jgi:hypothetical protein
MRLEGDVAEFHSLVDRPVGHDEIVDSGLCIIISEKKRRKESALVAVAVRQKWRLRRVVEVIRVESS